MSTIGSTLIQVISNASTPNLTRQSHLPISYTDKVSDVDSELPVASWAPESPGSEFDGH